jgi:UDP-glucose 4-epimerase
MSEQRYTQGMARPDIDIGTRDLERKPVSERTTLVTGGAGFIGGHLVRELLDTGRRVVVLDVQPFIPEARFVIGPDADTLSLELASIGDQARVLDVFRVHRPDEVVHAGMILDPAYLATNRATAFQVNVGGVINLVEAMIAFGVPRLVNFSSVGVLPRVMYEPIDSNHPILLADAGPGTDFYGSTKVAAEAMLFAYKQALGFDFRTVRRRSTGSA